jgi:hypothetical protein
MRVSDEVEHLREQAAELLRRAARRDTPLSQDEDAEILTLLKQAEDLELSMKRHHRHSIGFATKEF